MRLPWVNKKYYYYYHCVLTGSCIHDTVNSVHIVYWMHSHRNMKNSSDFLIMMFTLVMICWVCKHQHCHLQAMKFRLHSHWSLKLFQSRSSDVKVYDDLQCDSVHTSNLSTVLGVFTLAFKVHRAEQVGFEPLMETFKMPSMGTPLQLRSWYCFNFQFMLGDFTLASTAHRAVQVGSWKRSKCLSWWC